MSGISTSSPTSILDSSQPTNFNVKPLAQSLRRFRQPGAETAATALEQVQNQIDQIVRALRAPVPVAPYTQIADVNGNVIARVGYWTTKNQRYFGAAFANLWVGPGADPTTAPFFCNGSQVVVGQNGAIYVQDPFANVGAWLGTQSEAPQNVTGAVSAAGAIKLNIVAHGYRNGDWVNVSNVGGVPNSTGQWLISVVDADHFILLGSTFAGAYTAGGTVNRFFSGGAFETVAVAAGQRITNVVDNGSGLCRLTISKHGYSTGYAVVVTNVQGVPGANGSFLVTVIDANTVDLQGSVFSGAYLSGGVSLNWPTAKLLAQGDGSLLINNAVISNTDSGGNNVLIEGDSITFTEFGGALIATLNFSALSFVYNGTQIVAQLGINGGGSNQGFLTLSDSGGAVKITLDAAAADVISVSGTINASVGYKVGGTAGLTATRKTVLAVATAANGVFGTPGAGQSNGTVVTGVTLQTDAFTGGLLTS